MTDAALERIKLDIKVLNREMKDFEIVTYPARTLVESIHGNRGGEGLTVRLLRLPERKSVVGRGLPQMWTILEENGWWDKLRPTIVEVTARSDRRRGTHGEWE